jgi:hypothetical protein
MDADFIDGCRATGRHGYLIFLDQQAGPSGIQAEGSTVKELLDRLPDPIFKRVVGVLEMISRTPDQRRHYDARLKWELDENTRIQTAFEEGEAKGRIEGEARGEARVRIELIRTLENLLQMQISSDAELRGKSLEELRQRAENLQELIRNRSSS